MVDENGSALRAAQIPGPVPARIVIVLLGAIGDVVRALPLLGRIRRGFPSAHIAWAVEPKSAPILEHHPWLDELILFDRGRSPWSVPPFLKRVRAGRFDLVLDLQRILKSGVISMVSGAPDRIGFHPHNTKEWNHLFSTRYIEAQPEISLKLLQYQAFGDALGLAPAPIEFGLEATEDERARARELLKDAPRPLVGVILGSSWPSRIYFPEHIAAAIRGLAGGTGSSLCSETQGSLAKADATPALFPILLGGPGEASLAGEVMREVGPARALNLAGKTSLRDLIAIFPHCAAAFGPDSGPMHIAAALRCPVVSLWGATAPERSAPWGFADLALRGEIPCHPCYLRECPVGRECMHRLAPESVIDAVRRASALRLRPDAAGVSGRQAAAGAAR